MNFLRRAAPIAIGILVGFVLVVVCLGYFAEQKPSAPIVAQLENIDGFCRATITQNGVKVFSGQMNWNDNDGEAPGTAWEATMQLNGETVYFDYSNKDGGTLYDPSRNVKLPLKVIGSCPNG